MRFKNVLLVSTEHSDARPALERALSVAGRHGGAITLLHVPESLPSAARALPANVLRSLESALEQDRSELFAALSAGAAAAGIRFTTAIGEGPPFRAAIMAVLRDAHDLVLKTTDSHRPGARS
ncbi:MAG TPA: universal stress protein, partial [Rhodanobacteraceae bacterium]|nr:universal stress protein [Rhodanobacteraceae bacterium]